MLPVTRTSRGEALPAWDWPDREFDRMLSRWFGDRDQYTFTYPVDIREDDNNIYVDAELPGFRKDDVNITVDQGMLHISAERREESEKEQQGERHLQERRYRRFARSFTLPSSVDESKAEAKLEEGVLHLTLPKSEEVKPRRISVK